MCGLDTNITYKFKFAFAKKCLLVNQKHFFGRLIGPYNSKSYCLLCDFERCNELVWLVLSTNMIVEETRNNIIFRIMNLKV